MERGKIEGEPFSKKRGVIEVIEIEGEKITKRIIKKGEEPSRSSFKGKSAQRSPITGREDRVDQMSKWAEYREGMRKSRYPARQEEIETLRRDEQRAKEKRKRISAEEQFRA